jgi:hypothetical protein
MARDLSPSHAFRKGAAAVSEFRFQRPMSIFDRIAGVLGYDVPVQTDGKDPAAGRELVMMESTLLRRL